MFEVALLFSLILLGYCVGWVVIHLQQRRRSRQIEAVLRRLNQLQPPKPGFQYELRNHLLQQHPHPYPECLQCRYPAPSTTGSLPADGPNTSGLKPEPSPGVNPDGTRTRWVTPVARLDFSSSGEGGLDTRGRVRTIGLIPWSTPAQPGEPTSTAEGGLSGRASPECTACMRGWPCIQHGGDAS